MVPKVVETTLGQLAAEGQVFKDFKVVGNLKSTTVVLRYCEPDRLQASAHVRMSPLVNHKSPARQSRDMDRRHAWTSGGHAEPLFGANHENNMSDIYSQQWSSGEGTGVNLHNTGSIHLLANSDNWTGQKVQEFIPPCYMHLTDYCDQSTSDFKQKKYMDASVQYEEDTISNVLTNGENVKYFSQSGVQTDEPLSREYHSVVIQCQNATGATVETRTVGVSCRKTPNMKSHSCQATQVTKTQGVNAVIRHHDNISQTNIHGAVKPVKSSGTDVSVMCWQSPGGVDRHCQTYHAKSVCQGTNTKSTTNKNSSTDTCDLVISVASSCQTNTLNLDMGSLDTEEPQQSSTDSSLTDECHSPGGLPWGDLMSTELIEDLPNGPSNSDHGYIVPDSDVGMSCSSFKDPDQKILHGILSALGVPISTRTDYASLGHDKNRNSTMHHMIEHKHRYVFDGTEKVSTSHYCVFDDFIVPVLGCTGGVSETDSPHVGRYIKLYDNYEQHFYLGDQARFMVVSDRNSILYRQVMKAALDDLDNVINSVQIFHPLVHWSFS
jgi:hypothetical protein